MTEETRAILPRHRTALWIAALLLVIMGTAGRATAQTIYQLDGALDVGYTAETVSTAPFVDPAASETTIEGRFYTEIRPGIAFFSGSPRLLWRAGYLFAANISLDGKAPHTYNNQGDVSLAAQLSTRTTMTLAALVTQGGTAFQLSQRTADASEPAIRAPGNPAQVSATLTEFLLYELAPHFRLGQGLTGNMSAPQDDLGLVNSTVTGSVFVDRVFPNDAVGFELRSAVSRLQPLLTEGDPYFNITNSLLGRWTHDFDYHWNSQLTAGVQQVATLSGSYPVAILPTGSLSARYATDKAVGSVTFTHGTDTNLQTGTVSVTEQISAHGRVSFDPTRPRLLAVSVGFLHNEPLGDASPLIAAGAGNALQADVGFTWGLTDEMLATARYSLSYQFGQEAGIPSSLAHVVLIGITARYSNARYMPPVPRLGERVDGGDAIGFPESQIEKR